jgi:hypothetical protein
MLYSMKEVRSTWGEMITRMAVAGGEETVLLMGV